MKVHYFMPYVITAYPTLALPKTTSACMGNTIELKFLGQKWVGRKVSNEGCNNNGLCIEEVCGNAFASGAYDKIWAVTMNLIRLILCFILHGNYFKKKLAIYHSISGKNPNTVTSVYFYRFIILCFLECKQETSKQKCYFCFVTFHAWTDILLVFIL